MLCSALGYTRLMGEYMQKILVINTKGGCGKTTVATNLASYLARQGGQVTIYDNDPQGSSMYWLKMRPDHVGTIQGVSTHKGSDPGKMTRSYYQRVRPGTTHIIIDSPSSIPRHQLYQYVEGVDVILIPVLPSSIDIHASADFIRDLLLAARVRRRNIRIGILANRIRENTRAFSRLQRFLDSLKIPVIARMRDTQYYVRAAELGLGVTDLDGRGRSSREKAVWPLIDRWLNGEDIAVAPPPQTQAAAPAPVEPRAVVATHCPAEDAPGTATTLPKTEKPVMPAQSKPVFLPYRR